MNLRNPGISLLLKDFFDSVTLSGLTDRNDLEQLRKIRLMNLLVLTGSTVLYSFALYSIIEGHSLLGFLDALIASILFLLRFYLKKTQKYLLASILGISIIYIFFLSEYIVGGVNNTGFLWSYTLPLFTMFLLGSKHGLLLICIYLLITVILGFFNFQFQTEYSFEFRLRFPISFMTISLFAYYVELLRENISNRLMDKNAHLNRLIEKQRITELRLLNAKEKSDTLNKAKSEFLRNMSHELRTPLNHIIGFSQLVRDEIPGPVNDLQKEYMDDILDSSSHLLSLINDVLDIARIEAGKQELNKEEIKLREVLQQSMEMFEDKRIEKGLEFKLKTEEQQETLYADKRKLIQILYNLLSNAVKFSESGKIITLSSETDINKNECIISVTDSGIGIEPNSMELIFDTFGQVENKSNRRFEGTGLGLAITKKMVELHGGRIWAESEGLGLGSTFSFTLPLFQP